MPRITILGAGSWGLAVANLLAEREQQITLWKHDRQGAQRLSETRCDNTKLRGVELHPSVTVTADLDEALDGGDIIIIAVPAQNVRRICREMRPLMRSSSLLVSLAKGIEVSSLLRVSAVIVEELGTEFHDRVIVVSGPSHAEEVARGIPTSVVAAGRDLAAVSEIQQLLSSESLRVYSSDDVAGVELGGALKNIIALAAGMLYGLRLGDNTIGALLTRGLAEITRLGVALGARAETFAGLSGLGDLVTTCISYHSRNRYVGERIARGEKLPEVLSSMSMVAEGVPTTRAAMRLAERCGVEMPITQQVYEVLFNRKPPLQALNELMNRELKSEVYC